jgi:hypothetical protein
MFHDSEWPRGPAHALTTLTIRSDTGEILGVDIELNAAHSTFTIGDEYVDIDLLSVLTHELGHAFGLSHWWDSAATMYGSYNGYHLEMRDLDVDDIAGICTIYPKSGARPTCNTTKNFSERCGGTVVGSCAMSPRTGAAPLAYMLGSVALILTWVRRRRRCSR